MTAKTMKCTFRRPLNGVAETRRQAAACMSSVSWAAHTHVVSFPFATHVYQPGLRVSSVLIMYDQLEGVQ